VSAQELSFRLASEPGSVAESRRLVGDALSVWGVDGLLAATVALLASELVTNAVLHAVPPIDLTLGWNDPRLRVAVSDGEDRMPELVEPSRPEGDGGYGLRLVEVLSHAWGAVRRAGGGKVVWFEIERNLR
jgi:anti-sigma regulatory factor (Ser/Thr protein kinase)